MTIRQKIIAAFTTRLGLQPETARIASNYLPFDLMEQIILEVEKDQSTEDSINREFIDQYTCPNCGSFPQTKGRPCTNCGQIIVVA